MQPTSWNLITFGGMPMNAVAMRAVRCVPPGDFKMGLWGVEKFRGGAAQFGDSRMVFISAAARNAAPFSSSCAGKPSFMQKKSALR